LDAVPTETDPVFGLAVPTAIPDVPADVLRPRETWSDRTAYDAQARKLSEMFRKNFERFGSLASDAVKKAGPRG
jgi:phosphoenolpyruvate carboxykinase (ATP)